MINSYRILVGRLKAKDHLGDLSIGGRIYLKEIENEGMDWICLPQGRSLWWGAQYLTFWFHKSWGILD